MVLDDFLIIDSPGIRSFGLDDIPEEDLIGHFPDLAQQAVKCQFKNCEHLESSKGCAFRQLDDSYESKLILSRLESYLRFEGEVRGRNYWEKE